MEALERITAINVGHGTHEGMSGKHNEDSYGFFAWQVDANRTLHLGVVADGIGGQTAGELASTMAVQAVKTYFDKLPALTNINQHLEQAILTANQSIYEYARANPQYKGMGTTMVMAAFLDDKLYTAYVGDSRIYRLRQGRLQQLSVDHTWAQEAIEAGLLTREQAKKHPNRNVIKRYLGGILDVQVDHRLVLSSDDTSDRTQANQGTPLEPGDLVLLCSDGLTDMIDEAAVHASLTTHGTNLQPAVDEMIDKANAAGGKDNITVVTMRVPGGVAAGARPTTGRTPATRLEPAGSRRGLGVPLLLGGLGIVGALAIILVVGGFIVSRGRNNNGSSDSTPDAVPTLAESIGPDDPGAPSLTPGNPATAAVNLTLQAGGGDGTMEPGLTATEPPLEPTARFTNTPTRTPRPVATPTRTPSPSVSDTPEPDGVPGGPPSGGGGGSGPSNTPVPTNPPAPTNTPVPNPTNPPTEATRKPTATTGPPPTIQAPDSATSSDIRG